ncbi:Sterol 3-beta-glucosyltransferase UGT80A2 [Fusarium oxysporum f. sp. raphani]|uniref:Sterol 3-beta-glucosyltransferase UGT80A2 n=1 Tax=Fusarium oxysporum f. sp. raphani TaxID=96318 RepID=A0A8J5PRJ2_FUSOX|nr:Sterol 3-beta-glucosyltransferase UGT80A2 [Fusarium oxysporum f. sp. raphani]
MALNRIKSHGPGHVAIDDVNIGNGPSSDVISDGRVRVQFHDNPQALATWCDRFQGSFAGELPGVEHLELSKPRRTNSIAFLPDVEKPTCGPRLNIAIHIVGSRGDVQPFIPIAQILMKPPHGHRVRICTHPVFKDFVEAQGVEFFSIRGDPEALMAYMVKNPGLIPSRESFKGGEVGKRRREMAEIINGAWRSCIEAGDGMGERVTAANVQCAEDLFIADVIIANPPSMAHIHCAEKLSIPLHMVFTMPWSPTKAFPHPLAAMSYGDADARGNLGDLINKFRTQTLHLDPVSPMWGYQLLSRLRVPYSYLWSESLLPKPFDWPSHLNITGFSFLPLAHSYTPPPDLVEFLETGPIPIYVGFGSIVVDDPQALTQLIFQAIEIAGVRAIVSKGWGGVGAGGDVPDGVYLIGNCPHDWLFQRVSVVVHHGGAGTTAAGIAAGQPTVIIPFFGDQPFWSQMVARAGAGPTSVPFKELTAEILAESITLALQPEVQEVAQEMAGHIAEEDGAVQAAMDITDRLEVDKLRCDICPERLATWLHRKTGAHLSGFTASCLVDQGLIQPADLKLLRHKHWYVDEGAEEPITGVIAAASGFVAAVGTATSDYLQRLKSPAPPRPSRRRLSSKRHFTPTEEHQAHDGILRPVIGPAALTTMEMENIAIRLATKSLRNGDPTIAASNIVPSIRNRHKASWRAHEEGKNGRAYYVTRATGRYACDLAKAGAKAPVALIYNVANGFHNAPSHGFAGIEVRRRDEITGLGSGLKTAGKEFTLGIWEAFSGLVTKPYNDTKQRGARGLGKGMLRGGLGFISNLGSAIFGLPGYTLKGIEKELAKHHLTKLKGEVLLIRLRQGINDWREAPVEERQEAVRRWNALVSK